MASLGRIETYIDVRMFLYTVGDIMFHVVLQIIYQGSVGVICQDHLYSDTLGGY